MTAQVQSAFTQDRWAHENAPAETLSNHMEKHLRAHLIADAAGISDWDDESFVPEHTPARFRPNQSIPTAEAFAQSRNVCVGRIAFDVLAPNSSKILAIIGSGPEAESQLLAAFAHRDFTDVRIYARQPVAASGLAKKFRDRVQKPIEVCGSPEQAVHNADVIVLATGAARPIIDPDWVMPGVHISCAFPQEMRRNELPVTLLKRAKIIASDCPQQIGANGHHLMSGLKTRRRVIHLGAMIDRFNPDRQRGMTVFFMSGVDQLIPSQYTLPPLSSVP